MSNITTPKINNPQNFKSSNTLVTTRKPHYATKVNTAFNIVPGMHRPNANNMPHNIEQHDFIGPEFKARPLKHWRRQLVPTNPSSDNSTQKRMSRVYFMDTPGSTIYKKNDDTCRCIVNNAPVIIEIVPEVPGAVVITDIEYASNEPTVPDITDVVPRTPFQQQPEVNDELYNGHNSFEIAEEFNENNFKVGGTQILNNGQIDVPSFYLSAPFIDAIYNNAPGAALIIDIFYTNDENGAPPVPEITTVSPIIPFEETPFPDPIPAVDTNYHIQTGVFDTTCIACNPENNIIKSGITTLSQAYYSSTSEYLQSRCRTHAQRESTTKLPDGTYYPSATNIPFTFLYPNNDPRGPQVYEPKNCANPKIYNNNALNTPPNNYCSTIYKPNNPQFARQGAVSGSTRLQKLKSDTITSNGFSYYSAYGATMANAGNFQGTNESNNYFVKNRNFPLSQYTTLSKYRQNHTSGCCITFTPVIISIYVGVPGAVIIDEIVYISNMPTVPDITSIILF